MAGRGGRLLEGGGEGGTNRSALWQAAGGRQPEGRTCMVARRAGGDKCDAGWVTA